MRPLAPSAPSPHPSRTHPLVCLAAVFSLVAGCRTGPNATAADCAKACDKVALLETDQIRKTNFVSQHESEEHLEDAEDLYKKRMKEMDAEDQEGPVKLDPAQLAKLSPERRQSVLNANKQREELIVKLRADARIGAKKTLTAAEERLAKARKEAKESLEKGTAASKAKCEPACLASTQAHAECLQRIQSLDDRRFCKP